MLAASVGHAAPVKLCGRVINNITAAVSDGVSGFNLVGAGKEIVVPCINWVKDDGFSYADAYEACNLGKVWQDDGNSRLCPAGPTKAEVRV